MGNTFTKNKERDYKLDIQKLNTEIANKDIEIYNLKQKLKELNDINEQRRRVSQEIVELQKKYLQVCTQYDELQSNQSNDSSYIEDLNSRYSYLQSQNTTLQSKFDLLVLSERSLHQYITSQKHKFREHTQACIDELKNAQINNNNLLCNLKNNTQFEHLLTMIKEFHIINNIQPLYT